MGERGAVRISFALGRLTPGTNLLAFCVGIGWIVRRWTGAVVALLAASIPCTLFVVIITVLFAEWQENPFAQAAIKGAIAAAVAVTVKIGAWLAIARFPGRQVIIVLTNALLGLPPVVVGLALYLLLSRSGPLGSAGLLFTPAPPILCARCPTGHDLLPREISAVACRISR